MRERDRWHIEIHLDTAKCLHASTVHRCFCNVHKCTKRILLRSSVDDALAFPVEKDLIFYFFQLNVMRCSEEEKK